jgi:hypothetical protein
MKVQRDEHVLCRCLLFVAVPLLLWGLSGMAPARAEGPPTGDRPLAALAPLMINTDMGRPVVYLINTENDCLITVDLSRDAKFPGGLPLHTLLTPDGTHAYLTMMGSKQDPLRILVLHLAAVDWATGTAQITITKVLDVEGADVAPAMLTAAQVDPRQPVVSSLWVPGHQQLHGPTLLPGGQFAYATQWTDNKVRVIEVAQDRLAAVDPIQYGTLTRQMHGVFPNPSGHLALGTGYYFDLNAVTLFEVNATSGGLRLAAVVPLVIDEKRKQYAAFSHFVAWVDDRYAVTGTQQLGPTSLTPTGFTVVGPTVFVIDAVSKTARLLIGPATASAEGIRKPASDIAVIGHKLYVAEEDSMDEAIDGPGYLSVWDISDWKSPVFIKRLEPGHGLPGGFRLGHGLYRTPDGASLYIQDWKSAYLLKLNVATDTVTKIWDKADGFIAPHGAFIAGNLR